MGLQTAHDHTAAFLNRAYPTETFTAACHALSNAGIRVTAHIILGLPGETADMEIETIRYLNSLPINGIKISMLYVLKTRFWLNIINNIHFISSQWRNILIT